MIPGFAQFTETLYARRRVMRGNMPGVSSMQQQSRVLQRLSLKIPASAGNLGPGLDSIGLALALHANITFTLYDKPQFDSAVVSLSGPIRELSTEADQTQLIYTMLRRLWSEGSDLVQRVRVEVQSDIPLGAGLGSTTATILGSLWASKVLQDLVPTKDALIAEGVALEGYPETLAASLMGGFVVCAPTADGHRYLTLQHEWPSKWQVLLVVPSYRLKTTQARAVLAKKVALDEAVANIQRTALLVSAVANQDETALREALHDELHERSRVTLVPELSEVRGLLKHEPVIGCVLAGAGPSVVVVVGATHKQEVKACLEEWARQKEARRPTILDVQVDRDGMQIVQHQIGL
jgi:homoserine kinase